MKDAEKMRAQGCIIAILKQKNPVFFIQICFKIMAHRTRYNIFLILNFIIQSDLASRIHNHHQNANAIILITTSILPTLFAAILA